MQSEGNRTWQWQQEVDFWKEENVKCALFDKETNKKQLENKSWTKINWIK